MRSVFARTMRGTAPTALGWCRRGRPLASRADIRVVSTASWTPPYAGRRVAGDDDDEIAEGDIAATGGSNFSADASAAEESRTWAGCTVVTA